MPLRARRRPTPSPAHGCSSLEALPASARSAVFSSHFTRTHTCRLSICHLPRISRASERKPHGVRCSAFLTSSIDGSHTILSQPEHAHTHRVLRFRTGVFRRGVSSFQLSPTGLWRRQTIMTSRVASGAYITALPLAHSFPALPGDDQRQRLPMRVSVAQLSFQCFHPPPTTHPTDFTVSRATEGRKKKGKTKRKTKKKRRNTTYVTRYDCACRSLARRRSPANQAASGI